jgi:alpha-tubulin suppressor-like RCC1 family protein
VISSHQQQARRGCAAIALSLVAACGSASPSASIPTAPAAPRIHGLTAGRWHSCARDDDGAVFCWGDGRDGQLGDGSRSIRTRPVSVRSLPAIEGVAAGSRHTCARTHDGRIYCWGARDRGQIGDGVLDDDVEPALEPQLVAGVDGATQLSVGDDHACALRIDRTVLCWGDNQFGQLGRGESDIAPRSATPAAVAGLTEVVEVRAGATHTCARTASGSVRCWGGGAYGQLGPRGWTSIVRAPVEVAAFDDPIELSLGARHTCVLSSAGRVSCWGDDHEGQLGDGSTVARAEPVEVPNVVDAVEIDAGRAHTCVRLRHGSVRCWGRDGDGELGRSTTSALHAAELTTGGRHTCILDDVGLARCWGSNAYGQLGNGRAFAQPTPVVVEHVRDASMLRAGGQTTCARMREGWSCWGDDTVGGLADAATMGTSVPSHLALAPTADDLRLASERACSLTSRELSCWGRRADGTTASTAELVRADVGSVSIGTRFGCLVVSNGGVECWGEGIHGELGRDELRTDLAPAAVSGVANVVSIAVGGEHACAALANGHVLCWGTGRAGQLGTGERHARRTPTEVVGITDARVVVAGAEHTCALRADRTVACWGTIHRSDAARPPLLHAVTPTPVLDLHDVAELTSGSAHVCARMDTDAVWCWGSNASGQIGSADVDASEQPVLVEGVRAQSLAAGDEHTCALVDQGVVCWGSDANGQLGDAVTLSSSEAMTVEFASPITGS